MRDSRPVERCGPRSFSSKPELVEVFLQAKDRRWRRCRFDISGLSVSGRCLLDQPNEVHHRGASIYLSAGNLTNQCLVQRDNTTTTTARDRYGQVGSSHHDPAHVVIDQGSGGRSTPAPPAIGRRTGYELPLGIAPLGHEPGFLRASARLRASKW